MGKYYDKVGYIIPTEVSPSVWEEIPREQNYYGDVQTFNRRLSGSDSVNDNVLVNTTISIVADAFAIQNFAYIRYAYYMGVKWKVENATPQHPRILLTLGGIYHGYQT